MTLIVGIKCSDGIVMAADGAATLGNALGVRTVVQPMTKLHILQGNMVMGVSGPVGLGQLYRDRVESLWKTNQLGFSVKLPEVQRLLQQEIQKDAQPAIAQSVACVPLIGNVAASQSVLTSSLIAVPVGGNDRRPELIQCDHTGMAEAATNDLPFVSIGVGQPLADPFLAFLRHIFWTERLPRLADGVFAAVWTLTHAIRFNTGGLAEPIQITVLKGGGNKISASELSTDEIQEYRQHIFEAEQYLKAFKDNPASLPEVPKPPTI
jgi:20S proteasome alpha/beta subunit